MPYHKEISEHKLRLNQPMHEELKKLIMTLLDVGVIYPIADNSLGCRVQYMP